MYEVVRGRDPGIETQPLPSPVQVRMYVMYSPARSHRTVARGPWRGIRCIGLLGDAVSVGEACRTNSECERSETRQSTSEGLSNVETDLMQMLSAVYCVVNAC